LLLSSLLSQTVPDGPDDDDLSFSEDRTNDGESVGDEVSR
jgi:hypothetical protein